MRLSTSLALVTVALLTSGCGLGGIELKGGSPKYPGQGGGLGGGPGGGSIGCLEVLNEEASGTHTLVAVLLHDVETHLLVREEPVHLAAGQQIDLMALPAGLYEVVGVYEDWVQTPRPPEPPVVVQVHPDLEAAVRFRHP
jgi:hypothetical protein